MTSQMTVTTRDLRRLVALGDPARWAEPGDPLPPSILHDLAELVPCDDVIYQVHDAYREEILVYQGIQPPAYEDAATDALFWAHFWVCDSAVPELTGNHNQVIIDTDAEMWLTPAALDARAEYMRMVNVRYNAWISLAGAGADQPPDTAAPPRRPLLLSAGETSAGVDPSTLGRAGYHRTAHTVGAGADPPPTRVLHLVGAGFTNRQVGQRLGIAEGTVRKHLENAYATLQVTNRVAALDRTRAAELQAAV